MALSFGGASLDTGLWLLVYKYWEVSFTVPIQLKGETVSKKMKYWLKCGYISGISFILMAYMILCIGFVIIYTDLEEKTTCFLITDNDLQDIRANKFAIFRSAISLFQIVILGFFIDAASRTWGARRLGECFLIVSRRLRSIP